MNEIPAVLQPNTNPPQSGSDAISTFQALITEWRIPPARAWRMLMGVGYQAGSLTPEQVQRVEILVMVDQAMRGITPSTVGEWMVTRNGAPLFAGSAPADYLAKLGQPGYVGLLRQVLQWRS